MNRFHHNLETVLERGRRNSIEILNRMRIGSRPRKNSKFSMEDDDNRNTPGRNNDKKFDIPDITPEMHQLLSNINPDGGNLKPCATIIPMKKFKSSQDDVDPNLWKRHGNNNLGLVLSAMYAKLLVVLGIAFPLSEVISTFIPPSFYDGFYLYLYFGSIIFMTCILGNVIKKKVHKSARNIAQGMHSSFRSKIHNHKAVNSRVGVQIEMEDRLPSDEYSEEYPPFGSSPTSLNEESSPVKLAEINQNNCGGGTVKIVREHGTHFGSFYLRMGAVAFGIGSMIYSGLEFGQYFELQNDPKCTNYMIALTPSVRMIFTFMQMYFIFLNSKMAISKVSLSMQFGLGHMIGTNLCVWLNVLVQETRHEILHFNDMLYTNASSNYNAHNATMISPTPMLVNDSASPTTILSRHTRGLKGPYTMDECGRTNIMGQIVQNAAHFLFPCTIEYSLICAAICYVMWKSMAKRRTAKINRKTKRNFGEKHQHQCPEHTRSPDHYTVDCARANKGLFLGIFLLILTIMSLIVNFVFDGRPEYKGMAGLEVNVTEIVLYTSATISIMIGMFQIRELRYSKGRNLELDNILLIAAQTGSLIYNLFTIISGQFITKEGEKLLLVTAITKLVQLLLQTIFILDASKRVISTEEQARRKPGREVVTFLLVSNLAMWLINALEKSRGAGSPDLLRFYGVWGWTIITHVSMPMAIFYRFHSTVCLCEIWKRAFKAKRNSKYSCEFSKRRVPLYVDS